MLDVETEVDEALVLDLARSAAHDVTKVGRPHHDVPPRLRRRGAGRRTRGDREARRAGPGARGGLGPAGGRARPRRRRRRGARRQRRRPHRRRLRGRSEGGRVADGAGGPEVLLYGEVPDPDARPRRGAARRGRHRPSTGPTSCSGRAHYPPPPGASDVHRASSAAAPSPPLGEGVEGWSVGDEVCALLAGGGYAERVAVPAGQVMPRAGRRRPGDRGRAAGGGVHGLVQRLHGRRAAAGRAPARPRRRRRDRHVRDPAGHRARRPRPHHGRVGGEAGASAPSSVPTTTINYREQDFVEVVREATDGRGRRRRPRQHGREVPLPQRRRAGHRGPARRDRHAGRHQGRARPRRAAPQARPP